MVPQPDGDSSKVKVKVRINVHGIFSVSGASLIEKQKGEAEDMQIDSEPMVQNEGRAEDQVRRCFCKANISLKNMYSCHCFSGQFLVAYLLK